MYRRTRFFFYDFFFNDTATTEIYTLSLHDALPIFEGGPDDALRQGPFDVGDLLAHLVPDIRYRILRSEEHTSELQSQSNLVCRLLLEKKLLERHHRECS